MGEWLDPLRSLIAIGLALLLVMLRLEAASFNAAEYHESVDGRTPSFRRRVAWYGLGIALIVGILFVHPTPRQDLLLGIGDRAKTVGHKLRRIEAIVGALAERVVCDRDVAVRAGTIIGPAQVA